ncbi:hypothetical protein LBMAG57_05550 [Verrucomicrobiota bacterium]|nr:hypothetical protein LBMAG57_05550 [Verrucomicrobiota bacterium]
MVVIQSGSKATKAKGLKQAGPGQATQERRPGIARANAHKPQRGTTKSDRLLGNRLDRAPA